MCADRRGVDTTKKAGTVRAIASDALQTQVEESKKLVGV